MYFCSTIKKDISDINLQNRKEQLERQHRANKIFFWLFVIVAVINITYLIVKGDSSTAEDFDRLLHLLPFHALAETGTIGKLAQT